MSEREWIDVTDWNLRRMKPGAERIEASWGGVEMDWRGAVISVAGREVIGNQLVHDKDPETDELIQPGRLEEVAIYGDPPTREVLLANGYADRAEFPLDEADAERDFPQPKPLIPAGGERKTAETTHVEPHERKVTLEKAEDPGEMGAPVDVKGAAPDEPAGDGAQPEGYMDPFTDAPPAGISAADPAHNPPEGAPAGEQVEDLVNSGAAEVLEVESSDTAQGIRKLLRGGRE